MPSRASIARDGGDALRGRTKAARRKPYKLSAIMFSVLIAQCIRHSRVLKISFISAMGPPHGWEISLCFFQVENDVFKRSEGPLPSSKRMHVYSIVVNKYTVDGSDENIGSRTCGRYTLFLC